MNSSLRTPNPENELGLRIQEPRVQPFPVKPPLEKQIEAALAFDERQGNGAWSELRAGWSGIGRLGRVGPMGPLSSGFVMVNIACKSGSTLSLAQCQW